MSRFYASIQGNRSEATRQGTPNSGIYGHIRGWDVGVEVEGAVINGNDVFHIYATGGSNGRRDDGPIASVRLVDGELVIDPN